MSFFNPFRANASEKAKGTAGAPLELINYDTNTGKFALGKEALSVLRSVSPSLVIENSDCHLQLKNNGE